MNNENNRQGEERQSRGYLKEEDSYPLRETSANTQEGPGVLSILEADRIVIPQMWCVKGQVLVGNIFRELITAHRKDKQQKNQHRSIEAGHHP